MSASNHLRFVLRFFTSYKLTLVLFCWLVIGLTYRVTMDLGNRQVVQERAEEKRPPKIILYWTQYYDAVDFNFGLGREPFIRAGCPVDNCVATNDRQLLNRSDGILFHAGEFKVSDLPPFREPHQRYIFLLYETLPFGRELHFFQPRHFFNWTMTHRRDSDIYDPKPYGIMKLKNVAQQLPPLLQPGREIQSPQSLLMETGESKLANRTKLIAWFCSNQRTHGKREVYVNELSKFIPVDIYGKCGNLECLPRNSPTCDNLLDNYKFYLAAENSLCPDYITEKFYRALDKGVVPVVYGGADYSQFAPPHSYIHVGHFASAQKLAEYLLLLDRNEALYLEYFRWRNQYQIVRNPLIGWCQLCQKLNDDNEPSKSYESVAEFWFDQGPCLDGDAFLARNRVNA